MNVVTWGKVLAAAAVVGGLSFASTTAMARAPGMKVVPAPDRVVFDGVPDEWDGDLRPLSYALEGEVRSGDASAQVLIAYDDEGLYVAAEVEDDDVVGGRDHLSLLLGIPGGTLHEIALFPGVPGKSKGQVKARGVPVRGAKIVEAPRGGGYSLEAKIPWATLPRSDEVRVGYRGAVMLTDVDGGRVEAVISTADSKAYGDLPPLSLTAELALGSGLLRERNIQTPPVHNLLANVFGDKLLERVLVYDRFVVVLGPGYRHGEQYYFRDLGASADRGDLLAFELRDLTGDGRDDLLIRKRVRGAEGSVEVVEILSYHPGAEIPESLFAQEVRLELAGGGVVENELRLSGSGARTRIDLAAGRDDGIDRARFTRASSTGATPVLVPWGEIAAQTFQLRDGRFAMVDERRQQPAAVVAPPPTAPRPSPAATVAPRPAPRAAPDPDSVYDLYKKRAKITGKPRWDLTADLAEGEEAERLVVHDRDLVVFGPGFREGRAFSAVTLSHFERSADLSRVATRDVTRDGKHEVVVHGRVRAPVPADVGGGEMEREVVMIYKLRNGQLERIFAAEVGRRIGGKRVEATLAFVAQGRLELRPGRAVGYDARSYPWRQRTEPDGIFEPLVLPWGGVERVRLRFDGAKYVRDE